MPRVSCSELRARFAEALRSAEAGDPVVITRHGKPAAALIAAAQLPRLEQPRPAGRPRTWRARLPLTCWMRGTSGILTACGRLSGGGTRVSCRRLRGGPRMVVAFTVQVAEAGDDPFRERSLVGHVRILVSRSPSVKTDPTAPVDRGDRGPRPPLPGHPVARACPRPPLPSHRFERAVVE